MNFRYLNIVRRADVDPHAVPCVALLHNERNILGQFLEHYRALGPTAFFIVDDRSDDGSRAYLTEQPDVTLFEPKQGSTFARHLHHWRAEILDHFAGGRWCLAPDIDEHFVFRDMDSRPLADLIEDLEAEGADAFHCTMVDMYADEPIADHVYIDGKLIDRFPLFDDARSYRMLASRRPQLKTAPTPFFSVGGGMRERVFFGRDLRPAYAKLLTSYQWGRLERPMNPTWLERVAYGLERDFTSLMRVRPPFNCSKIPLLKWRRGISYSGAPHSVSDRLKLSKGSGALLHFVFTRGVDGVRYVVERGQHASRSVIYRRVLNKIESGLSPVGPETRRYDGPASLGALVR